MCWVMPPVSPEATSDSLMRSSRVVLPWSTWPMTVTTGGRGPQQLVPVVVVFFAEVAGLKLGFLLFAGVDEPHVGADLGGKKLDHVVRKRHRGRDHLALGQQETDDVGRAPVEPGASSWAVEPRSTMTSPSGTGACEGTYVDGACASSSSRLRFRLRAAPVAAGPPRPPGPPPKPPGRPVPPRPLGPPRRAAGTGPVRRLARRRHGK